MSHTPIPFPSGEEGLSLHLRLLQPDASAPVDFFRAYLLPLGAWLETKFLTVDADLRQSAVHDALINYVKAPQHYDPQKLDLAAYLRMATQSDLLNLLRGEKRHHGGRVPWNVVEQDDEAGYLSGREEDPAQALERAEEEKKARDLLRTVADACTPEEQRVLELLLAGEKRTEVFAAALGLEGRPTEEQEVEVKRVKDRLKKRLERGSKHG